MAYASQMRALREEIDCGRRRRLGELSERQARVREQVLALRRSRAAEADRAARARSADRRRLAEEVSAFVGRLADRRQSLRDRVARELCEDRRARADLVARLLESLRASRSTVARQLRDDLAKGRQNLQARCAALLAGYAAERQEAARAWRGAEYVRQSAGEAIAAEEAESATGAVGEPPVSERVLEIVSQHPEGITLVDMESALGLPRVRLGVVTRDLVDRGLVRKVDRFYYPAAKGSEVPEPAAGGNGEGGQV